MRDKTEYRRTHREELRVKSSAYYHKTKDVRRAHARTARAAIKDEITKDINKVKPAMLSGARSRAKRKGLVFDLHEFDFDIPDVCPALGIPLKVSVGKAQDNSPSLDRIDPSKGYVRGNVRVISNRANRIKCDASPEEMSLLADYVNAVTRPAK